MRNGALDSIYFSSALARAAGTLCGDDFGVAPRPRSARAEVEPFLERWRQPVTRHASGQGEVAPVRDHTTRTLEDALAELPGLPLT